VKHRQHESVRSVTSFADTAGRYTS
jgi:hypothetical protein